MSELLLTKEGYENLENELTTLQKKKIPSIKKRMVTAREDGDLRENNPWITAKEDLEVARIRVSEIKRMLKEAKILEKKDGNTVTIGDTVTVSMAGRNVTVKIVSTLEANPEKQMISEESALGKALINQKVGDTVVLATPSGEQKVEILTKT